jgi:hypothetical protein
VADVFYYIDLDGVVNGNGADGTPFSTLVNASANGPTLNSTDTYYFKVRHVSGTPKADYWNQVPAKHGGATIIIETDTGTTRIKLAPPNYGVLINASHTTMADLTIRDVDWTGNWTTLLLAQGGSPALNIVLDDCTAAGNATDSRFMGCAGTIQGVWSVETIGGGPYIVSKYIINCNGGQLGDIVLDSDFTAGSNQLDASLINTDNFNSFWLKEGRTLTCSWTVNRAIYNQNPKNATLFRIDGTIDATNFGGSIGELIVIDRIDAATAPEKQLNVVFGGGGRFIMGSTIGAIARFGKIDTGANTRLQDIAAAGNWGTLTAEDYSFIHRPTGAVTTATHGLIIGAGPVTPTLTNVYIENGSGLVASGHGFGVYANNVTLRNVVVKGDLGLLAFGKNIDAENVTLYVYQTGGLAGGTSDGSWDDSTGWKFKNSIVQVNGSEASGAFCISDYAYDGGGTKNYASAAFDGEIGPNVYYAPGGAPLARLTLADTHCDSIADLRTTWASWGTHPENDHASKSFNPQFVDPTGDELADFAPQTTRAWRDTEGNYFGAVEPSAAQPTVYLMLAQD